MPTKMPKLFTFFLLFLMLLMDIIVSDVNCLCPEICKCNKINENANGLKVKCGGSPNNKITAFKELDFGEDIENVLHLDLSKNQISYLNNKDFVNYTNLKRLDLSLNSLKQIDDKMFGEIPNLERLKLTTNIIVHILQGSFEKLKKLKFLDISGNPLACDCDLLWLAGWSNLMQVKLQPAPKCETPTPFKGFQLKKLKVGSDLHCESPLQPLLELKPETDQLVFEGDELVLRCRAPRVAVSAAKDEEDLPEKAHVFWGWSDRIIEPNSIEDINYRDPELIFPSIQIDAKHLADSGLLDSILRIPFVTRNHTGMWDCRLSSQQANLSKSISVIVISDKTKYCPAYEIRNNKGKYFWPRTIRGKQVRLPCVRDMATIGYATLRCSDTGEWIDLNTESCSFISEATRAFEQFAKANLSLVKGTVLESAKGLRNFTQFDMNLRQIRDPIDIVFIAETLKNYLNYVNQEKDLGTMILDIISQIITIPNWITQQAQAIDSSGSKIIQAIEYSGQYIIPSSMTHKPHLAIEYFKIRSDSFTGMTCTWMFNTINLNDRDKFNDNFRIFQCNTAVTSSIDIFRQHVDASVQIPSNLLTQSLLTQSTSSSSNQQSSQSPFPISQKLMVAVYENSNFLPYHKNQTNFQVTSAVIGVKVLSDSTATTSISMKNLYEQNLTEPISIMLRVMPFHNDISAPIPVWWDPEQNSWTRQGCQISYFFHGLLVFSCQRLGYYGLLQNRRYLNDFLDENAGAKFRASPIGFYIGGLIMFISSWINIVTYIACGNEIQMARKQRHSLINTWLAISGLSFVFTIGIYQTENYQICQLFGITIHYFSLCVILWVCVSVSNMYKRLSKRNRIPLDDLPKENIGRKPILGIYLVGWGIGLIICGISGAVNMREYSSYSYCFLGNGPALSAIFVPSTILLVFITILFICVRCHIRIVSEQQLHATQNHFSENTQATENVDLELLEPAVSVTNNNLNTNNINNSNNLNGIINHLNHNHQNEQCYRSLTMMSSPTTSSMQNDQEHSNGAQLRAHFIFLFLYLLCWLTAAASIVQPFQNRNIIYEEELFSILFALISMLLSIFILFFYCISRSDVRAQWSTWSCKNFCIARESGGNVGSSSGCCCGSRRRRRNSGSKNRCRNRSISDTKELNTTVTYHHGTLNSAGSRSNSQCSKNRPNSGQGNHLKNDHNNGTLARNESPSKIILNLTGSNAAAAAVVAAGGSSSIANGSNSLLRSIGGGGGGGIIGVHNSIIMGQQQGQTELPNPDIFYNPNQINVARKFFKKQKRLAKRNNFELQRQMDRGGLGGASDFGDNCGGTSDVSSITNFAIASSSASYPKARNNQSSSSTAAAMSIFSSGSKVNNTNIHVRNVIGNNNDSGGGSNNNSAGGSAGATGSHYSKDSRSPYINHNSNNPNPNILSDSCNENDMIFDTERCLVLGAESLRVLSQQAATKQLQQQQQLQSSFTRNNTQQKINNTEVIANIYTNVPETHQPQHEIVTMRADDKFRKSINVNDLLEEDEGNDDDDDEEHKNDLNTSQNYTDMSCTPYYINGNVRTHNKNLVDRNSASSSDENQKLLKLSDNETDQNNTNLNEKHSSVSLNDSPMLAMNTIGLPTIENDELNSTKNTSNIEQNSTISTVQSILSHNDHDDDDENNLDLAKNETYVSESLEISDRIYHDENQDQAVRMITNQQKKSKSLLDIGRNGIGGNCRKNINDILEDDFNQYNYLHETHVRSISCTNLSQLDDAEMLANILTQPIIIQNSTNNDNSTIHHHHHHHNNNRLLDSSSPILFSPSLCDINDLPSPADRRKPLILAADEELNLNSSTSSSILRLENSNLENGGGGSSSGNCNNGSSSNNGGNNSSSCCTNSISNNSDSLNLFSQSLRRQFCTSSSPTCESDLNYQNSELSIRSHGLYAPPPDNDLNLTLTGEDDCCYYPYQSSEISDIDPDDPDVLIDSVGQNLEHDDDDDCFNDYNNCSNDCLLPHDQDNDEMLIGSQTSLDELYQRITRRSTNAGGGGGNDNIDKDNHHLVDDCIAESNSILTDTTYDDCNSEIVNLSKLILGESGGGGGNNSSSLIEGHNNMVLGGEIEDDSSQGSIISYIDPNNCGNKNKVQH